MTFDSLFFIPLSALIDIPCYPIVKSSSQVCHYRKRGRDFTLELRVVSEEKE